MISTEGLTATCAAALYDNLLVLQHTHSPDSQCMGMLPGSHIAQWLRLFFLMNKDSSHLQTHKRLQIQHTAILFISYQVDALATWLCYIHTIFYKRLVCLLSEKWKEPYASVLGWIRCQLTFC